ncbi:MAG: NAD(+)--dinitrogen-reductase ADP-D-ribosyltransferase [Pseudomonadota bacterium]
MSTPSPTLPRTARLPINRCNLPAVILGSLTYQRHPVPLHLDGVADLHRGLFALLADLATPEERAQAFQAHMDAAFSLTHPEDAGYSATWPRGRPKANYLMVLRGWAFDPDGREGAVLKGWVESRFGLLPRHHGGPIRDFSDPTYRHYLEQRSGGLYNTNSLEAQLDLLYAYCQAELARRRNGDSHLILYRGVNRMNGYEVLADAPRHRVLLFNSLNSFTRERERACEFGDTILEVRVPLAKVFFFHGLLPGKLRGEEEFGVIGGVYEVAEATL